MKKNEFFLITVLGLVISFACVKSSDTSTCTPKSVDSERPSIIAYATSNSINSSYLNNGLYYQIMDSGTGPIINSTSKITVTYIGKLLNGNVFDQATTATSPISMSQLILGWQYGLPLIKGGGRIKLIIPSSLGYGCQSNQVIPANSILYFDVTVVSVQ